MNSTALKMSVSEVTLRGEEGEEEERGEAKGDVLWGVEVVLAILAAVVVELHFCNNKVNKR